MPDLFCLIFTFKGNKLKLFCRIMLYQCYSDTQCSITFVINVPINRRLILLAIEAKSSFVQHAVGKFE